MVFRLFTRKSTQDDATTDARLPTPTPSIPSVTHHSPSLRPPTALSASLTPSIIVGGHNALSPAPPPPATPSPPPVDTKALYERMVTIPPKTLHTYTLAHLRPPPTAASSFPVPEPPPGHTLRPPSPDTLHKLTAFFSTLAPPPLRHCVRCHKDFYEIENEDKDKACRVPHDDESALVSRISGGGYETLWGCCGQTAPGDGGEGPPDGWCYEGRHTTDAKRARFRADATLHDDKLSSCLKLHCHGTRDAPGSSPGTHVGTSSARKSNPSPTRSQASSTRRLARKRPRPSPPEASSSDNEGDAESMAKDTGSTTRDDGARTAVDAPRSAPSVSVSIKPKPRSRSQSQSWRQLPHASPMARIRGPTSPPTPAGSLRARAMAAKPKSSSRVRPSQSHAHLASDSEASTRARPRTRSLVREASRGRSGSKPAVVVDVLERTKRGRRATRARSRSLTSDEREVDTDGGPTSGQEERGRERKRRRVRRD